MLTLERKDGEAIIIQHEGQELRINVRRRGVIRSNSILMGLPLTGRGRTYISF